MEGDETWTGDKGYTPVSARVQSLEKSDECRSSTVHGVPCEYEFLSLLAKEDGMRRIL